MHVLIWACIAIFCIEIVIDRPIKKIIEWVKDK